MSISSLDDIDAIFAINLKHRKDRLEPIKLELEKIEVNPNKVFCIEGVHDLLNGQRGFTKSHIQALDLAIEKGLKNVLILKDDCVFLENRKTIGNYISTFFNEYKDNWDVFFLGTGIVSYEKLPLKDYIRIKQSVCANAYLIHGNYFKTLRNLYSETVELMKDHLFFHFSKKVALDQRWHELQGKDRWYVGLKIVAEKRENFSDIDQERKGNRLHKTVAAFILNQLSTSP